MLIDKTLHESGKENVKDIYIAD